LVSCFSFFHSFCFLLFLNSLHDGSHVSFCLNKSGPTLVSLECVVNLEFKREMLNTFFLTNEGSLWKAQEKIPGLMCVWSRRDATGNLVVSPCIFATSCSFTSYYTWNYVESGHLSVLFIRFDSLLCSIVRMFTASSRDDRKRVEKALFSSVPQAAKVSSVYSSS
jgi:hypothetical protein